MVDTPKESCKILWPIPANEKEFIKYLGEQGKTIRYYIDHDIKKAHQVLDYMLEYIRNGWAKDE